jgi:shikimate kinase
VLLTGMSGTGKSTVVVELRARGRRAVDLDCDEYSEWVAVGDGDGAPGSPVEPGRDWLWREDRVSALLSGEVGDALFVAGCAANMGPFLGRFDHVVLLHARREVIARRLQARGGGGYGSRPGELERVLGLVETVEPLLRAAASHEIDTGASLEEVVAAVLAIAGAAR